MTEFMAEQNPEKHNDIDNAHGNDPGIHGHLRGHLQLRIPGKSFTVQIVDAQGNAYKKCGENSDNKKEDVDPDILCQRKRLRSDFALHAEFFLFFHLIIFK